jgi:hypothetical protein
MYVYVCTQVLVSDVALVAASFRLLETRELALCSNATVNDDTYVYCS